MNLCNNLYLNFDILYCTHVCWLCSRFAENRSRWSWLANPSPRWFCHSLVSEKSWCNTLRYLKITNTLCRWRLLSPYKDYSSLLRWQANIFVHIPLRNYINEDMRWFWCVSLLLLFMNLFGCLCLCRTIRTCVCFLFLFGISWLFVLSCRTLMWNAHVLGMKWNAHMMGMMWNAHMLGMIGLFFVGTLTCIKSLAMMFESVVPPVPMVSQ
jgi:hypothetical protein